MTEPLRRCLSCGFIAYRFKPCHTCTVLGVRHATR